MNRTATMRQFHAALAARSLMDDKRDIIREHTLGRTDSASALTDHELTELVHQMNAMPARKTSPGPSLPGGESRQRMINSLYFHARQLGWFAPAEAGKEVKVDTARLNAWCMKHTPAHLPFKEMNVEQLAEAVTCIKAYVKTDTQRLAK